MTLVELIGIAIDEFGISFNPKLSQGPKRPSDVYMSPESVVGLSMVVFGTLLRLDCFRRLEKSFTFQLSVKQNHKLITDGPYAIVRHPSYTGLFMITVGVLLVQLGKGSWCAEHNCGVDTVGLLGPVLGEWNWVGIIYAAVTMWIFSFVFRRCPVEDKVLKAHFQDEWVRWAQKVPYRLIPYVW